MMSSSVSSIFKLFAAVGIMISLILSVAVNGVNPAFKKPIVLVIGDSIGNGHGLVDKPWPTVVQEHFDVTLINRSVSNEQTDWGLRQVDDLLARHRPTHILVLLGANDAVHSKSLAQSLENLQQIANKASATGAAVFMSTLLPITVAEKYIQRTQTLSDGIRTLDGVIVVDARAQFAEPDDLLVDGLHPNQDGQNRIAKAFIAVLDGRIGFTSKPITNKSP